MVTWSCFEVFHILKVYDRMSYTKIVPKDFLEQSQTAQDLARTQAAPNISVRLQRLRNVAYVGEHENASRRDEPASEKESTNLTAVN